MKSILIKNLSNYLSNKISLLHIEKVVLFGILSFVLSTSINAQSECRIQFYDNEDDEELSRDLEFSNSHLSSETLSKHYTIIGNNCPDGDISEQFVNNNFPDWLTANINPSSETITVTCLQNTTGEDRYYDLGITAEDLGYDMGTITISVIQHPASLAYSWYPDSDGDRFGDFKAKVEVSTTDISGKVNNNLDKCPDEYSLTNNGCIDPYENSNWIRSSSYDIKGNLLASSKGYFDALGKGIQTQTLDTKEQRIWATQTMYDEQGRAAFQTLSAPITAKNTSLSFQFNPNFIKKSDGTTNFTTADFETGDLLNPATIGETKNTLGWYYSDANTDEELQDKTLRPYSRTIFSTLNPGAVKQTIGGNKIGEETNGDGGEWKQGYSFSMPAAQEMYYVFGYDYFGDNNEEIRDQLTSKIASKKYPDQSRLRVSSRVEYAVVRGYESGNCITNSSAETYRIRTNIPIEIGKFYKVKLETTGEYNYVKIISRRYLSHFSRDSTEPIIVLDEGSWEDCEELKKHLELINNLTKLVTDSDIQAILLKATKSVVEDVHGNEAVVFTDTDGKTLAAARSGIPENPADEKQYEVVSLIGKQGYVDIHIPEGCDGTATLIGSASNYKIYDLKKEEPNGDITKAGFYRVEYIGTTELTKNHTLSYIDKISGNIEPNRTDAVGVRYKVNYYDFSLNYYNATGSLTSSLQPIGFNDSCLNNLSATVNHNNNAKSTFAYNSLGQLLSTTSPDEGTANFKYREDGQIRFSQNSKQSVSTGKEYSYTNYDEFGRPTESGVAYKSDGMSIWEFTQFFQTDADADDFDATRKEQHFTEYDFLSNNNETILQTNTNVAYHNSSFLAGNVASTWNLDEGGAKISQTFYSYDLYGRVQWIVQDIPTLGIKTIDYEYDPVTSQVLKVIYQKHTPSELFVHKYTYNIAQELVKVETSTDNSNFTTHAEYNYYETGTLKRVELAEGIQGIDYVYNLAGQLKAINHPNLTDDPGGDTTDLFGMTLDYYNGDYQRTNGFSLLTSGIDQFNGNIKGITWNTKIDGTPTDPFQYSYQYNKNNWLTEANFNANGNEQTSAPEDVVLKEVITNPKDVKATNSITLGVGFEATNNFTATIVDATDTGFDTDDYKVYGITYDANGNIQTLNRNKNTEDINGTVSNKMDELTYTYKTGKPNQLKRVDDAVTTQTNANDIKDQSTENNYIYNNIGQLTENKDEGVKYEYNASGLVTKVDYNNSLKVKFLYNDKGFRTKKLTYKDNSTVVEKTTDYILDAAGSTLAIYENQQLVEVPIYGASRLGIFKKQSNTSVYQLTDHLGNVRAVIAKDGSGNAAVLTHTTDYYPFGMPSQIGKS